MKKIILCSAMLAMCLSNGFGQEESDYVYLKNDLLWREKIALKDGVEYTGYVNAKGEPDVYGTKVSGKAYSTSQISNGVANGMLYLYDGVSSNYIGESKDDMFNGIGSMIVDRDRCMATFKNNKFADGLASRKSEYNDPNVFIKNGQPGPKAIEIYVTQIYSNNFPKIKQICEASNVRYVENMDYTQNGKNYKYTGGWKEGHPYFYGAYKDIYYGESLMCACGYIKYNSETGGLSVEKEFEVYAKNSYNRSSYYEYNSCLLNTNGDTTKLTQAYDYYNYAIIDQNGKYKEWKCLDGNAYTKFTKYVGERPWGLYFTPESMYEGFLEETKDKFEGRKISKYGELTRSVDGHAVVAFADGSSLTIYQSSRQGDELGVYVMASGEKAIGWFSRDVAQYKYASKPDGYASTIFPIAVKEYFSDNEYKRDFVYNKQYYPNWEDEINNIFEEISLPNSGRATFSFRNGNVYDGEWLNKKPNGYGKMTYSDGLIYEGTWKDGLHKGEGKLVKTNGDTFEGLFDNDFVSGTCKIKMNDAMYAGECKELLPNGKGQLSYSTGDIFEGEFTNGAARGVGVLTLKTGEKIKGMWENTKIADPIEVTTSAGVYTGKHQGFTLMDKNASISTTTGEQYHGEYNAGMNGIGNLVLNNGDEIITMWQNGQYVEGSEITYKWQDGRKYIGIIKKGELGKGVYYNADGSEAPNKISKTWIVSSPIAITIILPNNKIMK